MESALNSYKINCDVLSIDKNIEKKAKKNSMKI